MMRSEDILNFWFVEIDPRCWFQKSLDFDALVRRRFEGVYKTAAVGELAHWRETERGRLAEIILLDQMPRNMFRGSGQAFATDPLALVLAQEAVLRKIGVAWSAEMLQFLYMPYMHSESLSIHQEAMILFAKPGLESNLDYECRHRRILERFGRYPHRNAALGRVSTREELAFLEEPGSGF